MDGARVLAADTRAVGGTHTGTDTSAAVAAAAAGARARVHVEAALTHLERGFDGIAGSGWIHRGPAKAVLNHLQGVAALLVYARVALAGQQRLDLGFREILWDGHRKGQQQRGIAVLAGEYFQRFLNARGRVTPHRPAATLAMQHGGTREQQLQMIVELGHGADGGARGSHRVGLIDGYRRRNSFDTVDQRLVHPVQELPRVGGEGFDVAALALGVQRVEYQRGLAGAAHSGHDDQLVERKIEVEAFEIVLAGAADADGIRARRVEGWHSCKFTGCVKFSVPRTAPS